MVDEKDKTAEVSPAVIVARGKDGRNSGEIIIVLPTGDRARLLPVSAALIDEVTSHIEDPKPPVWHNPETGEDEPNFNHPDYAKALDAAGRKRGMAVIDATVMFGVELLDGVPSSDQWVSKIKWMAKHGKLVLDGYDLEDPMDMEFLYKRFIAVNNDVMEEVLRISGVGPDDVARAEKSFRRT